MLENLSPQAKEILEFSNKIADQLGMPFTGSESLLLAMFETPNTVCQFILSEYEITSEEIREIIEKFIILRKHEVADGKYTNKFMDIIEKSDVIRLQSNQDEIGDEHLFYGLLLTPETVALKILELLGLVLEDLYKELSNLFFINVKKESISKLNIEETFLVNLTNLARTNKLNPFVGRKKYINRIIKILSKKQKNNPLLIGSAGVGKTAIVEGLARYFLNVNPDITVYYLDLGSLMAGTKYRGDLEQRLIDTLKKLNKEECILFIDEIHNILGAGSSEGSLDIANILKPLLSRSEIKCIGATTLDEYYKFIDKDKALARRFQNVYIEEPSNQETFEILKGIKKSYEDFHNVVYDEELLEYMIDASKIIHNRKLPDKVIDILDESGYLGKIKNQIKINERIVDEVIFDFLGIDYENSLNEIKQSLNFPILKKYFLRYLLNINLHKTIVNIQLSHENLFPLLFDDLVKIFNIKSETVYQLDLQEYQEHHTLSSLLGAPPGYIGFDTGGQLTNHVLKFPLSVIMVKNFKEGHEKIKTTLNNILNEGQIIDYKGREVNFQNTIFVFSGNNDMNLIGFNQQKEIEQKLLSNIDVILTKDVSNHKLKETTKLERYISKFKDLGYNIQCDFKIEDIESIECFEDLIADIYKTRHENKIILEVSKSKNKIIIS